MSCPLIPSGHPEDPQTISFKTMRKAVGILGLALPPVLILGALISGPCRVFLDSLSAYYHGVMRDFFVGILCAVALFLFSYKGYDWKDFWANKIAFIGALGIALFPTTFLDPPPACLRLPLETNELKGILHLVFAFVFFLDIGLMSLCLFVQTDPKKRKKVTKQKHWRNKFYRGCGITILTSLGLLVAYGAVARFTSFRLWWFVPALESIALWAFGISWLVKGDAVKVLRDS